MFWNRRKKAEGKPSSSSNRIDELANRLQQAGAIGRLEEELKRFDPETLDGVEKEAWYHLYGIVPFRVGNRALAFERFQEGLRQCPGSGFLRFALGQEYEFRADVHNMFACFDQAKFPSIPAKYALAQARFAYLWSRLDKALSYIEPLIPPYRSLKILDDNFLYMRGLPFFSQTWAYLAAFHQLLGSLASLRKLTKQMQAECSDFDFEDLNVELTALETQDKSDIQARLEVSITKWRENNWPTGYLLMRYEVLKSQTTHDVVEAERGLDSVNLAQNDFPWLDDMRLLAKCELAHRNKDGLREEQLLDDFFRRQPLLFEPDHAVNFSLLKYQEDLKPKYQRLRKENG